MGKNLKFLKIDEYLKWVNLKTRVKQEESEKFLELNYLRNLYLLLTFIIKKGIQTISYIKKNLNV